MVAFGRYYWLELENWIELSVIILASLSLFLQHLENVVKWISAFGIVLAFLEMVILLGRYPRLGGQISIMFYNITRHLFKSISNLLVLIMGFAFGFFIMHHRTESEDFKSPQRALVKTLAMVLGEYELENFFKLDFPDYKSKLFAVALLVILAIIGSLVMVNLFVAIIVSDIKELKDKGFIQEVIVKAQHILHHDSIANMVMGTWKTGWMHKVTPNIDEPDAVKHVSLGNSEAQDLRQSSSSKIKICPHSLCNCSKDSDTRIMDPAIVEKLKVILSRSQKTK